MPLPLPSPLATTHGPCLSAHTKGPCSLSYSPLPQSTSQACLTLLRSKRPSASPCQGSTDPLAGVTSPASSSASTSQFAKPSHLHSLAHAAPTQVRQALEPSVQREDSLGEVKKPHAQSHWLPSLGHGVGGVFESGELPASLQKLPPQGT